MLFTQVIACILFCTVVYGARINIILILSESVQTFCVKDSDYKKRYFFESDNLPNRIGTCTK